jgi:hypothetical protein
MTAGAADRLAIRFGLGGGFGRVGNAELLAAAEQGGAKGKAKEEAATGVVMAGGVLGFERSTAPAMRT